MSIEKFFPCDVKRYAGDDGLVDLRAWLKAVRFGTDSCGIKENYPLEFYDWMRTLPDAAFVLYDWLDFSIYLTDLSYGLHNNYTAANLVSSVFPSVSLGNYTVTGTVNYGLPDNFCMLIHQIHHIVTHVLKYRQNTKKS